MVDCDGLTDLLGACRCSSNPRRRDGARCSFIHQATLRFVRARCSYEHCDIGVALARGGASASLGYC
jgi:hypothetical protein